MTDDPRLSELYRRLPSEQPNAAIDTAILAAARAATRRKRLSLVPWAAAATLLLGAGIGWQVLQWEAAVPFDMPSGEVAPIGSDEAVGVAPAPSLQPSYKANAARREPAAEAPQVEQAIMMRQGQALPAPTTKSTAAALDSELAVGTTGAVHEREACPDREDVARMSREQMLGLIDDALRRGDEDLRQCLERRFRAVYGDLPRSSVTPAQGE